LSVRVSGLTVLQTKCANASPFGVFTADHSGVPKGARFGPFQGKLVNTSEIKTFDDNTLMWEVRVGLLWQSSPFDNPLYSNCNIYIYIYIYIYI
jgi:hypothetical protein